MRLTHSIRLAGRFNDLFQPGSHFVLTTFPCELNMIFLFFVLGPRRAFYIFARGFLCEVLENFPLQLLACLTILISSDASYDQVFAAR